MSSPDADSVAETPHRYEPIDVSEVAEMLRTPGGPLRPAITVLATAHDGDLVNRIDPEARPDCPDDRARRHVAMDEHGEGHPCLY